ncbi:hypothetical protein IW262DRAFT_1458021 [Armillaria fumosa]|nr:hypothetical protein IW262DRAFT_1458021 [Armillaria fumosa]
MFKAQKTVTYGLSTSGHVKLSVPVHHQFTTFASGSLQNRYASPVQKLSRVRVRTISYSSIPISIVKAFRVPITVVLIGAGVYWYVCYRFEELKRWALGRLCVSVVKLPEIPKTWLNDVQVTADKILKSVTNDVGSRIREIKLPDISETGAGKFIKDLFGGQQHKEGDGKSEGSEGERQSDSKPSTDETVVTTPEDKRPPAWLKAVEGTANNILKSANDIGSRIQKENLAGKISETNAGKFINNLLGKQHKEGKGKSEGSEGERQSDKKALTGGKSEIVDKKDRSSSAHE